MKLKMLAIALGALAITQVACNGGHSVESKGQKQSNPSELSSVFSAIDGTYDWKNTTLTNKIEGISLDSIGKPARGIIQGQILVQGQAQPVHYYSDGIDTSTLKAGVKVDIAAELPDDNSIGGPLTGTFTCVNDDCSRAGVYFRFYQGAGFIFQLDKKGVYRLVNSVGTTVSLEQAMLKRGIVTN